MRSNDQPKFNHPKIKINWRSKNPFVKILENKNGIRNYVQDIMSLVKFHDVELNNLIVESEKPSEYSNNNN